MSYGDTNFYFFKWESIFITVNYLMDTSFENVDVPNSEFERILQNVFTYLLIRIKMVLQNTK